jgi:pSer/pThr/pTyr-binding forkhead associated (FHA) protein
MIVCVVTAAGTTVRFPFVKPEITIGRASGNDVVLPEINVSRRHARLVVKEHKMILVDLKSTQGTFVNGARLTMPKIIGERDAVRIASAAVGFRHVEVPAVAGNYGAADDVEAALVHAIASGAVGGREDYASCLEPRVNAGADE